MKKNFMAKLRIENTWDGTPLKPDEAVEVEVFVEQDRLVVLVDAPFHGDKAPAGHGGSTDRLWEYETVELFLAGKDSRYLEIELGPYGHYLVLRLKGVRQVEKTGLAMEYKTEIYGGRWLGSACMPFSYLPPGVDRANAYAMHGEGEGRRYLAAFSVPGVVPDFHQPDYFREIELGQNKAKIFPHLPAP